MSQPIATMQNLFQQFVALSRCFLSEESLTLNDSGGNISTLQSQVQLGFQPLDGGILDYSQIPSNLPSWFGSAVNQDTISWSNGDVESVAFSSPLGAFQSHDALCDSQNFSSQAGSD